jgi:signal peptidase I
VTVNGEPLDEPYVFENNPSDQRAFGPITVPSRRLFVMGDHRGLSQDSRAYLNDQWRGTVPVDQVIGRAFVTVWPVDHWRGIDTPATFEAVPERNALGPPGAPPVGDVAVALLPLAARVRRPRGLRAMRGRRPVGRARPRPPAPTP